MRVAQSSFPDELGRTVNELTVRQARLQTQASTGQRIRNAEDDPSAFLNVLQLQGDFQKLGQYSDNVSKLQTRSQAIYSATSQLKKMTDRASELATMANSIRTADDYAAYSSEVDQLLENSIALANSKHDSESLFGGTSGVDVAFEAVRDADGKITSVAYKGNSKVRQMDIASGVSFSIDVPGANESSSGPRGLLKDERAGIDVFGHLIALRDSLKKGDKTAIPDISASLVKDESGYIESFAELGAAQARLEAVAKQNSSESISVNQLISQESDADLAQTLVELNQLQAAYSAALQSAGKILRISLLDYI
jgi:flagellar hook-associated protein 3 FlgL